MHFIEQFLGLSPDGGSGATEVTYALTAMLAVALVLLRRRIGAVQRAATERR